MRLGIDGNAFIEYIDCKRRSALATLTVRNIPDEAKLRFRQVAAAHGRSMEEHLRTLIIEADFGDARVSHVAEAAPTFGHQPSGEEIVRALIEAANGKGDDLFDGVLDRRKYADIRYLTAKDAMAELRRLANGASLDLPPRLNPTLEAPDF
ncbi:hypothetical protein [Sphingomonas sp. 28-62-20]|uniref:FitA-like ribbon-helix-helix domain-containing protein n=1 Tax=Sphingomonas sp. 28-62-20 TaxID=1970433 RepID=UPI0035A824F2